MYLVVLIAVFVAACNAEAAAPTAPAAPAAPPPSPRAAQSAPSSYYLELLDIHGVDRVDVGSVPYAAGHAWIGAKDHEPLTTPELVETVEALAPRLEALAAERLRDAPPLAAPALHGDAGEARELPLHFDPAYMAEHVDVLVEAIDLIREFLAAERPGWRIGVFEGGLVIYPDAIFLGGRRHRRGADLAGELPAWLGTLRLADRGGD
jgi:hypothetical protein